MRMRGSSKFCQMGSISDKVLLVVLIDMEREDPDTTKTDHFRPSSEMPLKWRFPGGR